MRFPWQKKGRLLPEKVALIDDALRGTGVTSFADLGGVWAVEGGYTFHAIGQQNVTAGVLVDTHFTDRVRSEASKHSGLRLIEGNFGSPDVAAEVGEVGVVILFDVLLHQVAPDWDEIVRRYAAQSSCMVIYNQQWTGASTVRLLELGEDEYFANVPHKRSEPPYRDLFSRLDDLHPDHGRPWRDVHHIWQWGITDDDLVSVAESTGHRVVEKREYGRFGKLRNFKNRGFIFRR